MIDDFALFPPRSSVSIRKNFEVKGITGTTQVRNVCRLIINTNEETLPIPQDDRRICMFETNEQLADKDTPDYRRYQDRINDLYDQPAVQRAFYDYLMAYDMDDIDWIKDRPRTAMYEQSLAQANKRRKTAPQLRRESVLDAWEAWSAHVWNEYDTFSERATPLLVQFMEWCGDHGHAVPQTYNAVKFGLDIADFPGWERKETKKGTLYTMLPQGLEAYLRARNKL